MKPVPRAETLKTHKRWLIVVMLAGFGIVNYLDRQALSVLAPTLREKLNISVEQYSYVVTTFLAAYAIGYARGLLLSHHWLAKFSARLSRNGA
jgi:ACS family hexuronate transporter-like MFS transporter